MPITIADAPDPLPKGAKNIYVGAFNGAYAGECKDEGDRRDECSARIAWKAVKGKYKKVGDEWVAKAAHVSVNLYITKASLQEDGTMRWLCVASDTQPDDRKDRTTLALFRDWMARIDNSITVPFLPPPRKPFLGLSHYPSLAGFGEAGVTDRMYVDGTQFKAGGLFYDTTLGLALFEAIRDELAAIKRGTAVELPIRVSAAWWDIEHGHGDFLFRRTSLDDICPMCVENTSKTFLKGQLDHYAATRVPINPRTSVVAMEERSMTETVTRQQDAASIVDPKLADELEKQTQELLEQRSDADVETPSALVIKADDGQQDTDTDTEPAYVDSDETTAPDVEPDKVETEEPVVEEEPVALEQQAAEATLTEQQYIDQPEVWKPFGGATSISAAEAWLDAQEKMFQIYDSWGMFRAVMENILDDTELTAKVPAVRKAIDEFNDRVAAIKSGAADAFLVRAVVQETQGEEIMSETQEKQVEEPTEATEATAVVQPAPFDPGAAFWTAIQGLTGNMTLSRAEMLERAQTALETLASAVQNHIDSVRPPQAGGEEMRSMIADTVAAVVQPLNDQVALLLAKSQAAANPSPATPVQRSMAAPPIMPVQPVPEVTVATGLGVQPTSTLRAIARRSVGLVPN